MSRRRSRIPRGLEAPDVVPGIERFEPFEGLGTITLGCFGPADTTNTVSLSGRLRELGMPERDVRRVYSTFNAAAPAFAEESARHSDAGNGKADQGGGS